MAKRRIALLIATDTYADDEFPDLRTPCSDAAELASLLRDPEIGAFEVTTLQNRPAQEIRQVLDETFTDAHRDDLVLLHVSGHGIKDEAGKLHLVMSDTRRRHLRASAIAATWVRELIDHCAARRVVVWLDCCFSGAFPPGFTPKGTETVDAIDQLTSDSGRGCAVMTASTKIQYAFEKDQASVFTDAIMTGLRTGAADLDEDGIVDASELYTYVYDQVRQRTPDQTPTRNDVLAGDIYIAHNHRARQLPLGLAPEIRHLLRSSDPRFRKLAVDELVARAKSGDDTARSALAAIGEEPPQPVRAAPRPALIVSPATGFIFTHEVALRPNVVRGHKKFEIGCLAFDPLRPHDLCAGVGVELQWFHAATGANTKPSPGGKSLGGGEVDAVAFSKDGTQAVVGGPAGIRVIDPSTKLQTTSLVPVRHTRGLALSPAGDLLASVDRDNGVRLWDHRNWRLIRALPGHDGSVLSVAFSPDGQLLATAGTDKRVRLWEVSSGEQVRTLLTGHGSDVQSVAFSPDGRTLVTGERAGWVYSWDRSANWQPSALRRRDHSRLVSVTFNSDGVLATAGQDGDVLFWKRS